MIHIPRKIEKLLLHHLDRGKSILLLGPRQTGKSTLIKKVPCELFLNLVIPGERIRYEKDPSILIKEIEALEHVNNKPPLIIIDEVQKVPEIMDVIQTLIDDSAAQFVLTGSSARKLRRSGAINMLPGRIVKLRLDPLCLLEYSELPDLVHLLEFGSLPGLFHVDKDEDKEIDIESYVSTYLEEEVRAEALVRQMGTFARFLELAGAESGNMINYSNIAQDIGVAHTTIAAYFEILEDCLLLEKIPPLTKSPSRKRLSRSPKFLMFDPGVRRVCAREGRGFSREQTGRIFEQFIGLELIRISRFSTKRIIVKYWHDHDGPEVDWVIDCGTMYVPIEVKWTDAPSLKDSRHLLAFLKEYPNTDKGYIICRCPRAMKISDKVTALPWQELFLTVP